MPLQPNPLDNGALKTFYIPLAPEHAGALAIDYSFVPQDYGQLTLHLDIASSDHYSFLPSASSALMLTACLMRALNWVILI